MNGHDDPATPVVSPSGSASSTPAPIFSDPNPVTPPASSDISLPTSKKTRRRLDKKVIIIIVLAVLLLLILIVPAFSGRRPSISQITQKFNNYAGYLTTGDTQNVDLTGSNWYLFRVSDTNLSHDEVEDYVAKLELAYGEFYDQLTSAKSSSLSDLQSRANDYRLALNLAVWYSAYAELKLRLFNVYLESGTEAAQNYVAELTKAETSDEFLVDAQELLSDRLEVEVQLYEAYTATGCITDGVVDMICFSDANAESGAYRSLVLAYENLDSAFIRITPYLEEILRTETRNIQKTLGGQDE